MNPQIIQSLTLDGTSPTSIRFLEHTCRFVFESTPIEQISTEQIKTLDFKMLQTCVKEKLLPESFDIDNVTILKLYSRLRSLPNIPQYLPTQVDTSPLILPGLTSISSQYSIFAASANGNVNSFVNQNQEEGNPGENEPVLPVISGDNSHNNNDDDDDDDDSDGKTVPFPPGHQTTNIIDFDLLGSDSDNDSENEVEVEKNSVHDSDEGKLSSASSHSDAVAKTPCQPKVEPVRNCFTLSGSLCPFQFTQVCNCTGLSHSDLKFSEHFLDWIHYNFNLNGFYQHRLILPKLWKSADYFKPVFALLKPGDPVFSANIDFSKKGKEADAQKHSEKYYHDPSLPSKSNLTLIMHARPKTMPAHHSEEFICLLPVPNDNYLLGWILGSGIHLMAIEVYSDLRSISIPDPKFRTSGTTWLYISLYGRKIDSLRAGIECLLKLIDMYKEQDYLELEDALKEIQTICKKYVTHFFKPNLVALNEKIKQYHEKSH